MDIVLVGLNHKTAPVEIRERVAFNSRELNIALPRLLQTDGVREAVVVSTCNRTEVYVVTPSLAVARPAIIGFLAKFKELEGADLARYLYYSRGTDLVHHLFRVVCGLDSMVLGETEILGQVRDAYMAAQDHGSAGKLLHEVFGRALRVGKRAHNETEISANAVSVSYAAVELAKKVFHSLEGKRALIVGAGEMSQLTAKHLQANGVKHMIVANRTVERARDLAAQYGGEAIAMGDVETVLGTVDVVISSTGAPHYILDKARVQTALRARRGQPLFLVDIAVPRDIEPAAGQLDGVFLYDIDDLESVVNANLRARQREARRVEEIVAAELGEFDRWLQAQDAVPVIRTLRKKADQLRRREVEKALSMLPGLSDKERKVVDGLASSIVNKLLSCPTIQLRRCATDSDGQALVEAAVQLFDLELENEPFRAAEAVEERTEPTKQESNRADSQPRLAFQDRAD